MDSTYSTSSLVGFVSSNRRLQSPPNSRARPKFRQIDFAVSDVQVPVGFGREPGVDSPVVLSAANILVDDVANEVLSWRLHRFGHGSDLLMNRLRPAFRNGARGASTCMRHHSLRSPESRVGHIGVSTSTEGRGGRRYHWGYIQSISSQYFSSMILRLHFSVGVSSPVS